MIVLYHIGIYLYLIVAKIISPFNKKASLFVSGRKRLIVRISEEFHPDSPVIWFHCSSVGEFEQARPLIEKIKKRGINKQILITFFSPSGYELRKNYEFADWIYYLPLDTTRNARRFVEAVKPEAVIFIKYEFWYNFLTELKNRSIPTYIASAIFRPGQIFFRWYGGFIRKVLKYYKMLFVQDERSKELLLGVGVTNVIISGDTRFDRVYEIVKENKDENEIVSLFVNGHRAWVAGSTWEHDETVISKSLASVIDKGKLILVPHEVHESHIARIEQVFSKYKTVRYSSCTDIWSKDSITQILSDAQVLIVDCMGILATIYKYGDFAYIGGGFEKSGIHNILEAATYGCPVIFGPVYGKFKEACDLIECGGAHSISSCKELSPLLSEWLSNPDSCAKAAATCRNYIENHLGASQIILKYLYTYFRKG